MRTRRAFSPMVETMSSRLVLSSYATGPITPIVIRDEPTPIGVNPRDPVVISDPSPDPGEPYVGSDPENPSMGDTPLNT